MAECVHVRCAGPDQVSIDELVDGGREIGFARVAGVADRVKAGCLEGPTQNGAELQHATRAGCQEVEAGENGRLDRVRKCCEGSGDRIAVRRATSPIEH